MARLKCTRHPSNTLKHPAFLASWSSARLGGKDQGKPGEGQTDKEAAGTHRQVYKKVTQTERSRRHCVINLGRYLTGVEKGRAGEIRNPS